MFITSLLFFYRWQWIKLHCQRCQKMKNMHKHILFFYYVLYINYHVQHKQTLIIQSPLECDIIIITTWSQPPCNAIRLRTSSQQPTFTIMWIPFLLLLLLSSICIMKLVIFLFRRPLCSSCIRSSVGSGIWHQITTCFFVHITWCFWLLISTETSRYSLIVFFWYCVLSLVAIFLLRSKLNVQPSCAICLIIYPPCPVE